MCIIYYATHAYCTHRHLLGAFACGVQSPVHRPHIFHLDDNGFLCDTCMLLGGAILNPDIDPVRYNPPSFDNGEPTEWDEEVQERNRQRRRADMKTIPDEWMKQQQGWDDWGRDTGTGSGEYDFFALEITDRYARRDGGGGRNVTGESGA